MDKERTIEKLLRAFAKKRRDDAGAPLEMHSATRAMLQREAARRGQKPANESFFQKLLTLLRPALALGVGVAVIAFVAASLFWPASKQRPVRSVAMSDSIESRDTKPEAAKQQPALSDMEPASAPPVASRKLETEEARARLKDQSVANTTPLAEQPASVAQTAPGGSFGGAVATDSLTPVPAAPAETKTFADNETLTRDAAKEKRADADELDAAALASRQSKVVAAASVPPPPAAQPASVLFKNAATNLTLIAGATPARRYYRLNADQKQSAAAAGNAGVLADFQVEQKGRELRVVDGDGSVYSGYIANAETAGAAGAMPTGASGVRAIGGFSQAPQAPAASPRDGRRANVYFFQVAGTNRSLNQRVVFNGSLSTGTNDISAAIGSNISVRAEPPPANTLDLNSRISGKAVVNDQNEIDVIAEPAP